MVRKLPPEGKQETINVSYRADTEEGKKIHEWRKKQINVAYSIRQLILQNIDGKRFESRPIERVDHEPTPIKEDSVDIKETNGKSGVNKFFDD